MSEQFKPGDVVQDKRRIRVIERIQPHRIGAFIHFTDGTWTGEGSVELVQPSIPVSKIREVCERHKARYSNVNLQMAVALLRAELLEETP